MKTKFAIAAAMLITAAPVWAAETTVEQLSEQTGISERHVRMIVGDRTPYPEYPYTYERQLKKFKAALGEANYQRLMSGQPIQLPNGKEIRIVVAAK